MMVCPQCQQGFRQHLHCPKCNVHLLYQAAGLTEPGGDSDQLGEWQQTPWGKILVGLALTQGLCYGLQNLLLAGASTATGNEPVSTTVWHTLGGLVLLHALQALSLIVGGAICGAGQSRGVLYGTLVGLVNGLIVLTSPPRDRDFYAPLVLYSLPVVHMAFGALGGLIGRLIWRPTVLFLPVAASAASASSVSSSLASWTLFAGPVRWVRVALGIVVVVAGVVWSNTILTFMLQASNGSLTITSHLQAQLVGWEIVALAALAGAGFAGATTFNGFKQGSCVGVGAGVIVLGIRLSRPDFSLDHLLLTLATLLLLTLAGGWFGGQLFPPVTSGRRPRVRPS